jgi:hypothetical protein
MGALCCAYHITACPLDLSKQSEDVILEAACAGCNAVRIMGCSCHSGGSCIMCQGARCNDLH